MHAFISHALQLSSDFPVLGKYNRALLLALQNSTLQPGDYVGFSKSGRWEDCVELGIVTHINGIKIHFTNVATRKGMSRVYHQVVKLDFSNIPPYEEFVNTNPEYFI